MSKLNFLKDFEKTIDKLDGVGGSSQPPRYWYSFGNYVLNRIMSGSFMKGVPQGRITGLAGPSGAGKSFVIGNLVRSAQQAGAYILVIDSENALDDGFMSAIGVDVENNYNYKAVTTIPQVTKVVSTFLSGYKKEYGDDPDAPQVFIALDSLDMLMTETEVDHYDKGVTKGDQGQRNKQLKAMLRTFVQDIKELNVSMAVTCQVYRNQDLKNGEGTWIVSDAVRYALSQIVLLTKLKLKEKDALAGVFLGIKMKCVGYKTRFTKPFQNVTIEVPYDTGMDPNSGMIEVAVGMGLLDKKGSRYVVTGQEKSWYSKDFGDYAGDILMEAEKQTHAILNVTETAAEDMDEKETAKTRRKKKAIKP